MSRERCFELEQKLKDAENEIRTLKESKEKNRFFCSVCVKKTSFGTLQKAKHHIMLDHGQELFGLKKCNLT